MSETPNQPTSLYDLLLARTPRIPVTLLLITANLVVFVLMLGAGAGLWHSNNEVQLAWGANFGPATQDGQWWRLGSALFLHFGLLHIALNMWALADGGRLAERMYGPLRFTLIYFASGLFGNLLSLVVQGNQAVSGGASGAIFGVYGALLVFLWRERKKLDRREFRWLFLGGLAFTCVSISLGLFVPGIDNSAHIGGLLAGALAGVLFGRRLEENSAWPWPPRAACAALLTGAVGLLLTQLPVPSYRWSEEVAARQEIQEFLARETRIQASWQDIQRQDPASFQELAERIEYEIAEPYEESFEQLSELKLNQAAPSAARLKSLRAYSEQRRNSSQALAQQLRMRSQFGPGSPNRLGAPYNMPAPPAAEKPAP